jgi:hypothetical protein
MAYSTNAELTLLTGTALSTTIQDAIIAQADREIDARLYEAGLTPPGSDAMLKAASLDLSIAGVMTRARMDGTQPGSLSVGEMTSSDNIDAAIAELKAKASVIIDAYVRKATAALRQSSRIYKVNA